MFKRQRINFLIFVVITGAMVFFMNQYFRQSQILREIIERLTADSRIAEVVVTKVTVDPQTKENYTTIRFIEYDTEMRPLEPKYFTFSSNLIQFQSMVIRFDDFYVKSGHTLKGKSAYLFMKAFALKNKSAEVFEINNVNEIPSGYSVGIKPSGFEKKLWQKFWEYALTPKEARKMGIKNAQIEAPGTKFIPGLLYTIKIEHDGGMRVDAKISSAKL